MDLGECIDSRVINKITVKYMFPIRRHENIINMLSGAKWFLKLICVVDTIRLEFSLKMNEKQSLRQKIDFMSG